MPTATSHALHGHHARTHIRPAKGWRRLDLRELWAYRELLYFFVWRDVKVRYKQTVLGASWAVIQPLTMMVVFTVFLGKLAHIPTANVPYPLSTYVALVPWTLFAASLAGASDSLIRSSHLVAKVYFPRILLPISAAGSFLVDFLIASVMLGAMMGWYSVAPNWNALWLPFFLVLALVTAFGVGIWFAALNVRYRDVRYLVPFLTQLWLFASPVAYPTSIVPGNLRPLYGLNPMAGVIEGFRWGLLGTGDPPGLMTIASAAVALVVLAGGVFYFQRVERKFADVI